MITPLPDEDSIYAPLSQSEIPYVRTRHCSHRPKAIHDRIHDLMVFQPVIVRIIDTPQFQRLRDLHQLGNVRYIFSGGNNTRFEHSLGVAHLAMKMLKHIRSNHEDLPPTLDITEQDIVCVGLAGLCHDLGHGPLSHMFEDYVNKVRERKGTIAKKGKWHHEDASVEMFTYILQENKINMQDYGLSQADVTFVKRLIKGLAPKEPWPNDIGRSSDKRYLFDIVANKRNGIDVDKLDYFMRDSMSCFGKLPDLHVDRILQCARVIITEGEAQICFEEKLVLSLSELFMLRARLHKFVYQHRVVKVLDQMTLDALLLAEDHFRINLPDGRSFSLSETVEDMSAYERTGDWIINAIQASTDPDLAASRELVSRIRNRQLYKLVGCYLFEGKTTRPRQGLPPLGRTNGLGSDKPCTPPPSPSTTALTKTPDKYGIVTAQELIDCLPDNYTMRPEDIFITRTYIGLGSSGDKKVGDPISAVRFFNPKKAPDTAQKLSDDCHSPLFAPQAYEETTVFVFSRTNEDTTALQTAFTRWFDYKKRQGVIREPRPFVNASPSVDKKRPREDD